MDDLCRQADHQRDRDTRLRTKQHGRLQVRHEGVAIGNATQRFRNGGHHQKERGQAQKDRFQVNTRPPQPGQVPYPITRQQQRKGNDADDVADGLMCHQEHGEAAWSEGILHFMLLEAHDTQPGGALMISRLIDLVVIRILRTWVQQGVASGWLGGLSDARIARALKALHKTPGKQWRIDALAEIAGMSRSNFCERFSTLVGRSPLRYQNEWRLTLAKTMLSRQDARIGEIGFAIGYESEAAFSRAYKAFFSRSPREDNARPG